jgi:hypothetical protein
VVVGVMWARPEYAAGAAAVPAAADLLQGEDGGVALSQFAGEVRARQGNSTL